ncbi:NPCBM/NEW2 domain-containing protein [Kitasatospora sp. A2-31]|uniref:NPCBM/NEW2 domain-containing protein n=1 Tax=Kitasatospora sp. A2-31 TaxID=2916414 RepID=UPI001EEE10C7|nr:NPCBM/NEW2 domain-containing protein [Kitasatospora sp. A2-31]MCG6499729.1 NPCBM/NEW2 domain-containing protein [Kitasatospora sp. A2-31]
MTALTGVAGLAIGFLGLPAVVHSPTASSAVATETIPGPTVTVTRTVTAPALPDTPSGNGPAGTGPTPQRPAATDQSLMVLAPITCYCDLSRAKVAIAGKTYQNSLVTGDQYCKYGGSIEFNLSKEWSKLTTTVGVEDRSEGRSGSVTIYGDDRELIRQNLTLGESVPISVDLTGVLRLRIAYTSDGSCGQALIAVGDPVLTRVGSTP